MGEVWETERPPEVKDTGTKALAVEMPLPTVAVSLALGYKTVSTGSVALGEVAE
jgi:hypothetical protein